jgi:hypothetical protein
MAIIIPNPTNIPEAVSTGYQRQNTVIFASMVGFCNISMSNIGVISAGSVVEINGVLVKSYYDENVSGINLIPGNMMFFIYAVPVNAEEIEYRASIEVPEWSTEKSGYYDGGRAVIRASKDSSGSIGGITKMTDILYAATLPNEGGTLIYSKNVRSFEHLYLTSGWYRYEMASGLGNGDGQNASSSPGAGGVPYISITKTAVFWCPGCSVAIRIGGNGYNGVAGSVGLSGGGSGGSGNGRTGGPGGGSGAGAGEETSISFLSTIFSTGNTESGRGGSGGVGVGDYSYPGGAGGSGTGFGGTGKRGQPGATRGTGDAKSDGGSGGPGGTGFSSATVALGYEGFGGSGGGGGGGAGGDEWIFAWRAGWRRRQLK